MTPAQFVEELSRMHFANTFNPYSNRCIVHDRVLAPVIRSETLRAILEVAAVRGVDSIWLGRDLGYRGGRRTGLALTDDIHIDDHADRWRVSAERPTIGDLYRERTATVVWRVLSRIKLPVFLWNVFPLHPFKPGNPFSNRLHNNRERTAGIQILERLVVLLQPRRLVAIGSDAACAVRSLSTGRDSECVRHPSYGGQAVFVSRMSEVYDLDTDRSEPQVQERFIDEESDIDVQSA